MDGRDSAKCQDSGKRDISGILGNVNEEKDKRENSVVSSINWRPKET